MKIKNFYTANTAEPGDVFLVTVKAVVMHDGTYRLYRCPVEEYDGTIPDGDRMFEGKTYEMVNDQDGTEPITSIEITAHHIFPVLRAAKGPDLS